MSRSRHVRPSSPAVGRHRRVFEPSRLIKPGTIGALVIAVASLLGLGGTAALWQASVTVAPGTLSSGSVDITRTVLADASISYSSSSLSKTTSLTLTNSGLSSADVTAAVTTSGDAALAGAVAVSIWSVSSASACTTTASAQGGAVTWSALNNVSTSIAADQTLTYCLRTSLSSAQVSSYAGKSYAAALTLTAKRAGWTSSVTANVAQSVGSSVAAASCTNSDDWNANVTWPVSSTSQSFAVYLNGNKSTAATYNYWNSTFRASGQVARDLAQARGVQKVEIRPLASNGAELATAYVGWIYVSPDPESAYAQCATDPSTTPTSTPTPIAFRCSAGSYQSVLLTIDRFSGDHPAWLYEVLVDKRRIATGLGNGDMSEELTASSFSGLTKNRTYQVTIARIATGTVYYTGSIKLNASGVPSCA